VAVQLTIPAAAFAQGVPSRFGFQMFSGHEEALAVRVLDRAGQELVIDLDDYVASGRAEIDWSGRLPDFICDHNAQAGLVTVTSGDKSRTVSCPSR
jgi:hypothetical protein